MKKILSQKRRSNSVGPWQKQMTRRQRAAQKNTREQDGEKITNKDEMAM